MLRQWAKSRELSFITVVSYGRTGSTVIQSTLNSLPGVLVRGENYGAFRGLGTYMQSIAEVADRHHARKSTHPWFGSSRLEPGGILADIRRHAIEHVLCPEKDTQWLGFKEVRYEPGHFAGYDELLSHLVFLGHLFPGLRYVMNVRDPDDTARSGWWPGNPHAIEVLTTARAWLLDAASDLNTFFAEHRATAVAYEGWLANPEVLIDAYAGLGLPRDDEAVRATMVQRLDHGTHS